MEKEIELEQEAIVVYSGGGAVNSVNGYTGDVVLTTSDLENTSDYQTGTEVESAISTAIAGKQDTLTAGNNITISNNTISATDTTYSAGTGLTLDGTQFSVNTETIATQQDVSNEATARENADNNLQGQIDAISASSDVTDIVGTYAALQAYDTTQLKDNDIIKVLQDESQNDETTYYRWSTSTQTFTLIGEEGPYYTKSQTDTLLQAKQDTLTAGSNITIASDNTISATDTTYSDFTGTDGTAAGAAGLVPAPATTDAGKFLGASGLWEAVQAGGVTELTADDYNWPTSNPDGIAMWLLDTGLYKTAERVKIYFTTVNSKPNSCLIMVHNNGYQNACLYMRGAAESMEYWDVTRSNGSRRTHFYVSAPVNNLTSSSEYAPLSANQGKVLKDFIGDLTNLTTTDKTNLVAAINEAAAGGGGGGGITELTTADYDYPTDNPNRVLLGMLPAGIYYRSNSVNVGVTTELLTANQNFFIIMRSSGSTTVYANILGPSGSANNGIYQDLQVWRVSGNTGSLLEKSGALSTENLVQSTGTSTTSVMSQNATTNAINAISQSGAGAPTTATVGAVGQLYQDTTNGKLYICTDATNPYVWEEVGAGGGGGVTLYDTTLGENTDGAPTQKAVNASLYYKGGGSYSTGSINIDPGATRLTKAMSNSASIYIGLGATTSVSGWAYQIAIGSGAIGSNNAVSIGSNAGPSVYAKGSNGVYIGPSARTSANYTISIGVDSSTSANGSIALGAYSSASSVGEMNIGSSDISYGYNSSNYRLLTGVYDPQNAHDAATKGYVDPTTDSSAPTTATVGRLGQIQIDTTTATAYMCVAVDTVTPAYTWKQITA